MARPRMELQNLLVKILGSKNVYFKSPASNQMKYPCIRYNRSSIEAEYADNIPYIGRNQYTLTLMYKDPDSDLPFKIASLPSCKHVDNYTADNICHDIFTIYF